MKIGKTRQKPGNSYVFWLRKKRKFRVAFPLVQNKSDAYIYTGDETSRLNPIQHENRLYRPSLLILKTQLVKALITGNN
jgi:hypothetical protein